MMNDNYAKAYREVYEILMIVPVESLKKIPDDIIETLKVKRDLEYDFSIDITKSLEEQDLLRETKAILANLYRDYWATPTEKQKIIEKEKHDRIIIENKKREKYNPDDIFKKKDESKFVISTQSNLPTETKQNFFKRVISFIKSFLKK